MKAFLFPDRKFVVIPRAGAKFNERQYARRLTAYLNSPAVAVEMAVEIERLATETAQAMLDEAIRSGRM